LEKQYDSARVPVVEGIVLDLEKLTEAMHGQRRCTRRSPGGTTTT
jgi:hypothetical protein